MLVFQTSPVEVELFSYEKPFFLFCWPRERKRSILVSVLSRPNPLAMLNLHNALLNFFCISPFRPERSPCLHPCFWEEFQISRVGEEASFHRTLSSALPSFKENNKYVINNTKFWETGKSKLNPRDCTRNKTEKYMSKLPVYGWTGTGKTPLKARGETPYNDLYGEAPPERVLFSGFRFMKEEGFH